MLDLKLIRIDPETVKAALRRRNMNEAVVDELLALDEKKRKITVEAEQLRHLRNQVSDELAGKKSRNQDISEESARMRQVGQKIKELETEKEQSEEQVKEILSSLPNLPHPEVPDGKDENDNPELKRWGELKQFDFTPLPHWELGEKLGILDIPRAVRMSKTRFVLLKGKGAQLSRAILNFMLEVHTREHGYIEVSPPYLVNSQAMFGTGQLPKFEEDLFKCRDYDLYLIPTSEVPLTNLHREDILEEAQLPLYYTSFTPCFRSEAGAAGKDTRGMIRVHQFDKVELVKFTTPETSFAELDQMVGNAEVILQRLKLPYRQTLICIGDLGFSAAKKYDLEIFCPGQDRWLEVSSLSNCTDFQARRAQIRYRNAAGKIEYLHTLNGSGLAIGRILVGILENYQTAEGGVLIPEALQPYLNGVKVIEPT